MTHDKNDSNFNAIHPAVIGLCVLKGKSNSEIPSKDTHTYIWSKWSIMVIPYSKIEPEQVASSCSGVALRVKCGEMSVLSVLRYI